MNGKEQQISYAASDNRMGESNDLFDITLMVMIETE